jgi:hypothetical protein
MKGLAGLTKSITWSDKRPLFFKGWEDIVQESNAHS